MGRTRNSERLIQAAISPSQTFKSLGIESSVELKDAFLALALSETVYRVLDPGGLQQAAHVADELCRALPNSLDIHLRLQWSSADLAHRYMVAQSRDALYVAFMGTKQRRDILTNAKVGMVPIWPQNAQKKQIEDAPEAHSGFLHRARSVDINSLYRHASQQGLRLILCGHSLGGAVAQLCTLDLLKRLEESSKTARVAVSCIGYATPAIGNAALASLVEQKGWHRIFNNYILPEDVLGSFFGRRVHPGPADITGDSTTPLQPAMKHLKLSDLAQAGAAADAKLRSSVPQGLSRKRARRPEKEPHSLNNIVPCPQPQLATVFSQPLHLGLPSPLLRDLLSGARGELSSMALEMADTDAWLFRNDASHRPRCSVTTAAARLAHGGAVTERPAATKALAAALEAVAAYSNDAPRTTAGRSIFSLQAKPDRWGASARSAVSPPGSRSSRSSGFKAEAAFVRTPSRASLLHQKGALAAREISEDPLTSPCSSISSSSLDSDEEAALAAAGHILGHLDNTNGVQAPSILRRARAIAGAFLLPVAVLGAYVPIGRQWSLSKPAQVESALGDSSDIIADSGTADLPKDVSRIDVLQRRLRTVFWMHRLPVYRARVREIYDSVCGGAVPAVQRSRVIQKHAWLVDDVAPAMHAHCARVVVPAAKEDWSGMDASDLPIHPRQTTGKTEEPRKGLLLIEASLLLMVCVALWRSLAGALKWLPKLHSAAFQRRNRTVHIAVHGQGLQSCTRARLILPGVATLPARVVQKPTWEGFYAECGLSSGRMTSAPADRQLLLSVQVPHAKVRRSLQKFLGQIQLMSDFHTTVADVVPNSLSLQT